MSEEIMTDNRVVSMEFLQRMKRKHYYCEDGWYSCPKAKDGCYDEWAGTDCNCGADEFNAEIDRELAAALEQRDKAIAHLAIAHLVNMLHAADELADCVGITKWDTEIDMARIFLKECGK